MNTLAYKRNDSATDVMGMKAKAAFLRASDDFPIAATAPGSMNIRSDIQNSGSSKAWRAGFMLRCFRSGSLPYDVRSGLPRMVAGNRVKVSMRIRFALMSCPILYDRQGGL